MSSKEFKTRTEIKNRVNAGSEKNWVMGLDIGYSAVKLFCANKAAVFPSYARKINENSLVLKEASETDIRYRDKDGVWVIGNLAYEKVNASEAVDSETELFSRNRYYSPMFKVISRTGLAIGLMANTFGNPQGKNIKVQTGLPPKYMNDANVLKESLAGHHEFELKVGKAPWQKFNFTLATDDIYVMPQPLGSLVSASTNREGKQVPEARNYFSADEVVIFDPGCGTLDDYTVRNGSVDDWNTFSKLGMHEVFARTCDDICKAYGREILVPELQNYLTSGEVKVVVDKREMKREIRSFEGILEENSKKVCLEAIEQMKSVHNYFDSCDYIIATGGTYDAWAPIFNAVFKDMDGLKIVPGNINDPELSNIYSNVRGYYFYLLNKVK